MSEAIERIARAIYEGRNGHGCKSWSLLTTAHKTPYRHDASAAIAAAMPDWQHIDTAPKDGSHVILAVTGDGPGPGYVSEGYYESDDGRGWFAANTHWTDYHDGQLWPSHWQPLPTPPEVQS